MYIKHPIFTPGCILSPVCILYRVVCVFFSDHTDRLTTMDYIMEHIEFTKIMHPSRNPRNVKDPTNVGVKIFLIYAAANIENYEIFTQRRWKFDIFMNIFTKKNFLTCIYWRKKQKKFLNARFPARNVDKFWQIPSRSYSIGVSCTYEAVTLYHIGTTYTCKLYSFLQFAV